MSHLTRKSRLVALLYCCLLVSAACAGGEAPLDASQPDVSSSNLSSSGDTVRLHGSCTLNTAYPHDEDAIQAVIKAEAEFVVKQEIKALMQLWNDGAFVADAKNTPTDTIDDQRWIDKDAIRHRYVRTVFPGAPATANPKDLIITLSDTQAVITATTQIGTEVSLAGDRWALSKHNGCWGIDSLTYNLENRE